MFFKSIIPFVIAIALCSAPPLFAQVSVTAANNVQLLLASTDKKHSANKKLVYDFWREVLVAGHMELAPKYMLESYIQHNPNIETGREAFIEVFGKGTPRPISDELKGLVSIVAEGDFVILAWVKTQKDPVDRSKTYTTTAFDMFRIENGKLAEHWDAVPKTSNPSLEKQQPNSERKEVHVATDILNRYTGIYQLTPDKELLITLEGNQLNVTFTGSTSTLILAESTVKFFTKLREAQFDFVTGDAGTTTHLIFHSGGRDYKYLKLADQF